MEIDFKWFAIMVMTMLIAVAIGVSVDKYSNSLVARAAIEAGLEECPNPKGYQGNAIWVKDCIAFTKEAKDKE